MSYKDEYDALWVWFKQKSNEYDAIGYREHVSIKGKGLRDSPLLLIRQQDVIVFNRRLLILREKYGLASAKELEDLARLRASEKFDEEMYEVAQWFKGKVLECLDAVEKGELSPKGLVGPFRMEDCNELIRRQRALEEKYGVR
ncbi:MAG: hypothetical protein LBD04_04860 [Synergistaceae bacterium]|jgi:hypothetical protein|nr:hypothetical protein [Synergistaceae bacterium]